MKSTNYFDINADDIKRKIDSFLDKLNDTEFYESLLAAGYDTYKDYEGPSVLPQFSFAAPSQYTVICTSTVPNSLYRQTYVPGAYITSTWTLIHTEMSASDSQREAA